MASDSVTGTLPRLENLVASPHKWQPAIEEALVHGRHAHDFDDIVGMILINRLYFFTYERCFVIMEQVEYPKFKVFHCFLAGGDMDAIFAVQPEMAELGKTLGCTYLSIAGRKGWEKKLATRGWSFTCTTMYFDLGEDDEQRRREGRGNHAGNEDRPSLGEGSPQELEAS